MKPTTNTRREFLLQLGAMGAFAAFPGRLPAISHLGPKKPRAIVAIYLRGGADWLNMVIPWKDKDYISSRPTIRLGAEQGVVPLDSRFGLHPALSPLAPLYEEKQFAPVLCVGSPHGTRSHFDAQDFMERAAPGLRNITSGWLNRYLTTAQTKDSSEFRALAMQELLPRSLRGDYPALAVPTSMDKKKGSKTLDRFEQFYGDGSMMNDRTLKGSDNDEEVVQSGRMTIDTLRRFQEITAAAKPESSSRYPNSKFGKRLQTIATVIKAQCGLEVAALDYTGWDHHIGQGGLEGRHNTMLSDYAQSLAAFSSDLGALMNDTLVVTMTEFGRTVRENGNAGTDHGRGGGVFLLGGGVKGGKIYGEWRGLKPEALAEGRDLPVTTDFRDVMASCLKDSLNCKLPKDFFPGYKPNRLKLFA
ncbi:MAG: DUF1501 domain-containing protein [Planctomycetota bacterium]|jgi:uncharacterized protein (DUF1501 family)|nr:DUF1501 domain-containing protein [Planctomycetota bacterium]